MLRLETDIGMRGGQRPSRRVGALVAATIGAMVYNLVTHLGGGIEVTLKETD